MRSRLILLLLLPFLGACGTNTPKGRMKTLGSVVRKAQEDASDALKKAGLPQPPRAVDLMTGGNWGTGIDLQQAMTKGYPPSCQIVYEQTCQALRGMVFHYSKCLGLGMPEEIVARGLEKGAMVFPPGYGSSQGSNLPQKAKEAYAVARISFAKALVKVAALGPFDKPTPEIPNTPRSALSSILSFGTEATKGPKIDPNELAALVRETGLEESLVLGLRDLDETLDLRDKMVNHYTIKMVKRYRMAYVEIDKIYEEGSIPRSSPLQIPRLEQVLKPSSPGYKERVMHSIPDQLSKSNMVHANCEKNMGAICAGIQLLLDPNRDPYCRHRGWENINEASISWAAQLKSTNPGTRDIETLKRVSGVIDRLLKMEFNYLTNARDYPG